MFMWLYITAEAVSYNDSNSSVCFVWRHWFSYGPCPGNQLSEDLYCEDVHIGVAFSNKAPNMIYTYGDQEASIGNSCHKYSLQCVGPGAITGMTHNMDTYLIDSWLAST